MITTSEGNRDDLFDELLVEVWSRELSAERRARVQLAMSVAQAQSLREIVELMRDMNKSVKLLARLIEEKGGVSHGPTP